MHDWLKESPNLKVLPRIVPGVSCWSAVPAGFLASLDLGGGEGEMLRQHPQAPPPSSPATGRSEPAKWRHSSPSNCFQSRLSDLQRRRQVLERPSRALLVARGTEGRSVDSDLLPTSQLNKNRLAHRAPAGWAEYLRLPCGNILSILRQSESKLVQGLVSERLARGPRNAADDPVDNADGLHTLRQTHSRQVSSLLMHFHVWRIWLNGSFFMWVRHLDHEASNFSSKTYNAS